MIDRQARAHRQFAALRRDTERAIDSLVDRYLATGDARQFAASMRATLTDAHAGACYWGRTLAGDTAPPEEDDRKFARLVVQDEAWFLDRFADDLEAGRYHDETGNSREAGIRQRALLYAGKLSGTAAEAWGLTLGPDEEAIWRLSPAEHCKTCLSEAALSWRLLSAFTRWPGGGDTLCLTQCKCFVETRAGAKSISNASA